MNNGTLQHVVCRMNYLMLIIVTLLLERPIVFLFLLYLQLDANRVMNQDKGWLPQEQCDARRGRRRPEEVQEAGKAGKSLCSCRTSCIVQVADSANILNARF